MDRAAVENAIQTTFVLLSLLNEWKDSIPDWTKKTTEKCGCVMVGRVRLFTF